MKKGVFTLISIAALLFSLGATALAKSSETMTQAGESVQIPVTAIYKAAENESVFSAEIIDGKASVTTADGTVISLSDAGGALPEGVKFHVREITEKDKEAFDWLSSATSKLSEKILPYYIYFEVDGEPFVPDNEVKISITYPNSYKNPIVLGVSLAGKAVAIKSEVKGGAVTFSVKEGGYFVLGNQEKSVAPPKVGDLPLALISLITLAVSAGLVGYSARKKVLDR